MKHWNRNSSLILFSALIFVGLITLSAAGTTPPRPGHVERWLSTPEAQIRTQQGVCPTNFECKELCINAVPTGQFDCILTP